MWNDLKAVSFISSSYDKGPGQTRVLQRGLHAGEKVKSWGVEVRARTLALLPESFGAK